MGPRAKKYLIWFLVIFFVYAIFRDPQSAAGLVGGAVDGIVGLLRGVGQFFDALLART
ncbi:MAG: hypothetical protein ACK5MT_08125 [Actinomycetales bacterium]